MSPQRRLLPPRPRPVARRHRMVPELTPLEDRTLLSLTNAGVAPGVHLLAQQVAGLGGENVYQFQVLRTDNLDVKLSDFVAGSPFTDASAAARTYAGTASAPTSGKTSAHPRKSLSRRVKQIEIEAEDRAFPLKALRSPCR